MEKRTFSAVWKLVIGIFIVSVCSQRLKAQETVTVIEPVADTWVRSTGSDKTINYGTDTTFMTRHSSSAYIEIAFLKFDLTDYTLPQNTVIDSVRLFMAMVYNQSSGGVVNILPMDDNNDSWDENTITWSSGRPDTVHGASPIISMPVAKLNPQVNSTDGIGYYFNITGQVLSELSDSNKILSLAAYPDYKTDVNIKFLSRESALANLRPQLMIYTHTADPNSFDINAFGDTYNDRIELSWKTINENDIAYYEILHGTDGSNFTYIAHVNSQGNNNDTVEYTYEHNAPQANLTHYYRIQTVLKDSSRHNLTVVSAAFGITGMEAKNIWEFTQVPSIAATSARLMQSLQMADFNPVGLRAEAGVPLTIKVDQLSGTDLPKLIVGTYDRQSVSTYDLSTGVNTITNANGGDLYIKYSSDNPTNSNKVRVTFQTGYKEMPLYILGNTTHQQWLDQLSADTQSPNVTLISNRVFIVVSKDKAIQYQGANQDTLLTYMDEIMRTEDEISGLDNSSPLHAPAYNNKLMLLEKAGGNPDATSLGRVRIPTGSISWILDPAYITDHGGWGIFHEIGHHHQQYPWSWSACTEVTVNIYSMAAKRLFHPDQTGMASSDWDKTMVYLEQPDSLKNYNNSANYVKLGLWNQMGMAFGDSFYHAMHKRTREERIVPSGDSAEVRLMMLYASEISGKNLSHFFRKWRLPVAESVYGEIAALSLPAPATDPSELREDWSVTVEKVGDLNNLDSIVLRGHAYGPEGVKKVEFYANGNKIGESTSRPFNFVWKSVAAGSYTVYIKAIGNSDTVLTSNPINVVQKAISITYPLNNTSLASGSSVDIQTAIAPGTDINDVEFFANGTKIGQSTTAPYHYNWSIPADTIYSLQAKVNYQDGGSDFSSLIGIFCGGFLPVADAYVRDGGSANTNFGQDTTLVVKTDVGGYNRISYLKFNPGNYSGSADSLKLALRIASANHSVSVTQWQLWLCHNASWKEDELTWSNRPQTDSLLGTIDTKSNGEVEWTVAGDIHPLLNADGILSLAVVSTIVNGTSDASFYSRDASSIAARPRLTLYSDGNSASAVPVVYSPLKATLFDKSVLLHWQTFNEMDAAEFVVEHSTDGRVFRKAGAERSLGKLSAGHSYDFIHSTPDSGVNYYRLKILSQMGAAAYSNVTAINFKTGSLTSWKLYPNPLHAGTNVVIELPAARKGKVVARVVSLAGQVVYSQRFSINDDNKTALKTGRLKPGIYFVMLLDEKGHSLGKTEKLVVR